MGGTNHKANSKGKFMDITQLNICSAFFSESEEQQALEAVGLRDWYWKTGSVLKIHFMNGSRSLMDRVARVANEWTKYANLTFDFYFDPNKPPTDSKDGVTQPATDIAIEFWSYLGGESHIGRRSQTVSRTGSPSMKLPQSGNRGVVLHEFGHALGLMHEHLSPTAGIQWNKDVVYQYYETVQGWSKEEVDSNVFSILRAEQTNYTTFDQDSIMIYEIPKQMTLNGFSVQRNNVLSSIDKSFIAKRYPGK